MNELQELLRGGVLDLSIMIRGLDRKLDSALDALKDSLRGRDDVDSEAFRKALDATDRRFDEIECRTQEGVSQLYALYQVLVDADGNGVPDSLVQQLKEPSMYVHDVLELAKKVHPLASVPAAATDSADDGSLVRLRQKLCSRFITLLRTLAILGDEDGALNDLAQRLEPIPDWTAFDLLAAETVGLIQNRLNLEKGKFEYYLNELNSRLSSINQLILEEQKDLSQFRTLNDSLNSNVDEQLTRVQTEIDSATDLQGLRLAMNQSMEDLLGVLTTFQESIKRSLSDVHSCQTKLSSELKALQADNRKLVRQIARERELSMRDPLTQLPNRQGFDARLAEEISRSERYQQPCCIALIDIDFFKAVNDQYGHLAGDKVLKVLAKEMRSQLRKSDYLARFGGEEFVMLLAQTEIVDGTQALEKIRRHISECPFNFQRKRVHITFSAGISEYRHGETADQWLDRADKALYVSKDSGRNKTTAAD